MVKYYQITDCKLVETQDENAKIPVYINPDEQQKKFLLNILNIDEHTLNSALDPDELSRLEFEPDHLSLIFKRPKTYSHEDNLLFKVNSMGIFLFKDRLIVVLSEDVPIFDGKHFLKVLSLEDIVLKLIYRIIIHFLEHLKIINMISNDLELKIGAAMENKYLLNLFTLEKGLVYYLNAIMANSAVIERIRLNAAKIGLSQENQELLDDIIIENNQCYKQAEIYSNILASLMDARASIVSNNLNILIKTLNVITIGIMVPTFVVSAFSMNVGIPLSKHPFAFWIIITLAFVSVITFMLIFRFKKW